MRIACGIEYFGSPYFGWQRQTKLVTVQAEVEAAVSQVANEPIQVQCAGRTDTGVHATAQVMHFDTDVERTIDAWLLGTNANLPDSIRIRWVKIMPDAFHARFSATERRYQYYIDNRPVLSNLYKASHLAV